MPTCGEVIREQRRRRGMYQVEVALATGVSAKIIQAMERGSNCRVDDLLLVINYIGLPLNQAVKRPR